MKGKITFKILFMFFVISFLGNCSFNMLTPEAKKMKKLALITVYVTKQGIFKGNGADRKVRNQVAKYYEFFEDELGKVKGWKVVPVSAFSNTTAYKQFYKDITNSTGYNISKVHHFIAKDMVYLERGMFTAGGDQAKLKKLLQSMDVDGAIVVSLKLKFAKSGGFSIGNIGTSNKKVEAETDMMIVDRNAEYVGGGLRSFTSDTEIKSFKLGADFSDFEAMFTKNTAMFDEAVKNSAINYKNLINKELN